MNENYEKITCPVCGGQAWALYKCTFKDSSPYLRVVCCTPGCRVDNAADSGSKVSTIWEMIEADKEMVKPCNY
jgi:hypothetical protein